MANKKLNKSKQQIAYEQHKINAKHSEKEFLFTFEEWWKIWKESGRWPSRGNRSGKYVMARFNDIGPYAIGNVKIILFEDNMAEGRQTSSPFRGAKISFGMQGNTNGKGKRSPEFCAKMKDLMQGNTNGHGNRRPENRAKFTKLAIAQRLAQKLATAKPEPD